MQMNYLFFRQTVRSVHWSSNIGPQICYLCVVHTQHISLWKVDGQSTKLGFKQIRKLNLQPIPQGKNVMMELNQMLGYAGFPLF